MKKYLIPAVIVLMVLAVAWPVLAQREGTEAGRTRREGQERFQGLSEEEKEKIKAQMRERFAGRGPMLGREDQLKAIEEIEKQLAELKKAVATGPERIDFRKLREGTPEEQAKLRESWEKARLERQKLINGIQEQLTRLSGPRPQVERPALPIIELKEIQALAVKENAKGAADRIEKLIASLQKAPEGRDKIRQEGQRPKLPESEKQREKRASKKANVEK
jgi:hypothetical protein